MADVLSPPESSVATPVNGVPASDVQRLPDPSVTSLVSGIIADLQQLIQQQLAMFRQEIRDSVRKTKEAAQSLAAGAAITWAGSGLLVVMLPLLLHWAVPALPLWACFGIVGGVLAALGWALLSAGAKKLESIHPLPDKSTDALKENLKWTTNPK
jgi:hypothetical protein